MLELLYLATVELARFLQAHLPALGETWWQQRVVERLTYQQQRILQERQFTTLEELDLAALLRVFDQNWYELCDSLGLPREGRNWVKELQSVRNRWAHGSSQAISASDVYRDADTLERMLRILGAPEATLSLVEATKREAFSQMAGTRSSATPIRPPAQSASTDAGQDTAAREIPLFNAGDLVALRSDPTQVMSVLRVIPGTGERRYQVFYRNARATYYESQLQAVEEADERRILDAAEVNACLTSLQILSPSIANLFSLRTGRVTFVPYQYRPVLKLIRADRPRLLIADEVGVGKTIEAGLIIKELRARMDLSSVLIICPKALVAERKWFLEMKRFDEQFDALDGPMLRYCLDETELEGEWPDKHAKAIVPFSLFDTELLLGRGSRGRGRGSDKGLLNLDPPPKFDLVIVDEAHHIRHASTCLHQAVRYFCDNAQAAVFLTATPVEMGSEDLYTLLNVLRPDLIIDQASFSQMAQPNGYINEAVRHCRAAREGWQADARASLEEAATTEWGRVFLRESPTFQTAYDRLGEPHVDDAERVTLTRSIEELYTFSDLINRTRRRDIGDFTTRRAETVERQFTPAQRRLHDGLLEVVARILMYMHAQQNVKFMMTTIRRQAASCLYGLAPMLRDILAGKLSDLELMEAADVDFTGDGSFVDEIRSDVMDLLAQAEALDGNDPKVEAFVKVITDKGQLPNNKALVFSTFRHTLAYLAKHLLAAGVRFGLVHGQVPDEERAELRRRFALPKDDPDALEVLLSSEVGCEGLDFQFCDFLVNYDLPWNPMRIEQRIGRIDRYGQKSESVAIVNLVTPGTVDADIYFRCLLRIGVFQHAVGGNEEILGELTDELHEIAERFDLTPEERNARLQQLADNKVRQLKEEEDLESKQAELLGLNPPAPTWRREIERAESAWLSPAALQACVELYLAQRLEVKQDYLLGERPLKTLRLSQEARSKLLDDYRALPHSTDPVCRAWERWLKGDQPNLQVTFDQATAADNAKAVHLVVTHPLLRQAARRLRVDEAAYALLAVKSDEAPPGEHLFGVYRWQKQGVRSDEALVAVASAEAVEEHLLDLLPAAMTAEGHLPAASVFEALDARHYEKWREAQALHIAENREQVEHRKHSLAVSHRARCKMIEDQLARATDNRIQLMKQSELTRANADFERRRRELEQAANSGDVHATPVLFGVLTVER